MKADRTSGSHISRRDFLKRGLQAGFAAGLSSSLWVAGCGKRRDAKPSNVIIISIDTLRADHLGCYGYQRRTSPILDKLAAQSLLFEDVSTPSPWTLPAHISLLTGLYPNRHGVKSVQMRLPDDIATLSSVLSRHGFATASVVNSIYLDERFGFARGLDHYTRVPESPDSVGVAPVITAEATKWASKHRNQRFFLFLHYYDVHSDYRSLPHYEEQFVRPYDGPINGTTAQLLDFRKGRVALDQADVEHLVDLYDASIRQMDDELNKVFSFLQEQDLFDQTLLIVTSDHGEEFLEHGGVLHGRTQFQELIHVPFIMSGPGLPRGRRIRQIGSLVDVMPTILGLLGIAEPSVQNGVDLRALWQNRNAQQQRFIFAEADHNNVRDDIKRAVRHQRYKLHYDLLTKKMELYDLLEDPGEKHDISSASDSMVNSLLRRLEEFTAVEKAGEPISPLSPQEIEKLRSLGYL